MKEEVVELRVGDVVAAENNPRAAANAVGLEELAASIEASGLQQPVVVRPHPSEKGKFELRIGSRRLAAFRKLGRETIPAIVREMDDAAAAAATAIENLQREDLSPIETARGLKTLADQGLDAKEIARRVGRHFSWVYRRLSLCQVTPGWLESLGNPKEAGGFSAKHLELVARLPAVVQDGLLKQMRSQHWHWEDGLDVFSAYALRLTRALKGVPWDLLEKNVAPKTPMCGDCGKRSFLQPDLFGDGKNAPDLCLDKVCFDAKFAATIERQRSEAEKKLGRKVATVTAADMHSSDDVPLPKDTLFKWNYRKVKAEERGASPALIVAGPGVGKTIWIKKGRDDGEADRAEKASPQAKAADEKKAAEKRADAWLAAAVSAAIQETPYEKLQPLAKASTRADAVSALLITVGPAYQVGRQTIEDAVRLCGEAAKGGKEFWARQGWEAVKDQLVDELHGYEWGPNPKKLAALADLVGADLKALRRRAAAVEADRPSFLAITKAARDLEAALGKRKEARQYAEARAVLRAVAELAHAGTLEHVSEWGLHCEVLTETPKLADAAAALQGATIPAGWTAHLEAVRKTAAYTAPARK